MRKDTTPDGAYERDLMTARKDEQLSQKGETMIPAVCERCRSAKVVFIRKYNNGRQYEFLCDKCYQKLSVKDKGLCDPVLLREDV